MTCGTIQGGYGYNIIADKVKITGTVRTMSRKVQERVKTRMCEVCSATAAMFGGKIDVDYAYGYPPTVNAYPECVEIVKRAAAKLVGDGLSGGNIRTMGAEDFSYFLQERPGNAVFVNISISFNCCRLLLCIKIVLNFFLAGCFFFVGAQLPGDKKPHHKSNFDFDESALLLSSSVYVQIIRDLMTVA